LSLQTDAGFVTSKKQTTSRRTSFTLAVIFSLGSTVQTKLFAISQILAENVCN